MRGTKHISTCIDEWLDTCPFNLPDALEAIREEYAMTQARHQSSKDDNEDTTSEGVA
ncbi:MAG: hypothetical protein ABWX92_00655 [Mycetocola sp.]